MKRQKWLHRSVLATILLAAGMLGGLVAPVSSQAGNPTLYIDGNAVTLQQGGPGCGNDTGFKNGSNSVLNSCYTINGANVTTESTRSSTIRIGNWYVGSIASTNVARVLINDTATGRDDMKLSGVTFTRADVTSSNTNTVSATFPCDACRQGHAVVVNVFNNAPNGTGSGTDYLWAMTESGNFDPPGTENVLNNRFRLIGTGCFATTCSTDPNSSLFTANLGTALDTGIFISSTSTNVTTGISKSNSSSTVKAGCNTGSGRCAPTLRYDYEFTVQGLDTLKITDSVDGCGGQCNPNGPIYSGNGSLKLIGCTDTIAGDGSTIPGLKTICDNQVGNYVAAHATALQQDNGVFAETCEGTCIVIEIEGTPARRAENTIFDFCAGGQGIRLPYSLPCNEVTFSRRLDAQGNAVKGFSNLAPDSNPNVGDPNDRFFTIPVYPPGGSKGTWETDAINCSSSFNNGTASWIVGTAGNNSAQKISLTVLTIAQGDILTCSWHVH